jgi:hypothetical protein
MECPSGVQISGVLKHVNRAAFPDREKRVEKGGRILTLFNTPSSNPDYTVGFGVAPNQRLRARGLYRRSGISPCPEDIIAMQLSVSV